MTTFDEIVSVLPPSDVRVTVMKVVNEVKSRISVAEHNAASYARSGGELGEQLAERFASHAEGWRALLRVLEEGNGHA